MAVGGARPVQVAGEDEQRAPARPHAPVPPPASQPDDGGLRGVVAVLLAVVAALVVGGLVALGGATAVEPRTAEEFAVVALQSDSAAPSIRLPAAPRPSPAIAGAAVPEGDRSRPPAPAATSEPGPSPVDARSIADPTTGTGPDDAGAVSPSAAPGEDAAQAEVERHERVGRAALDRIDRRWQERLAGWTIEFHPGRAGLLGGTWTSERRIELYIREHHTVDEVAFTLAHELAHALDVTQLDDDDRARWREEREIAVDHVWWVEGGRSDFASGAGDFAESFAVWQVGGPSKSQLGGAPDEEDVALLIELLSG